MPAHARLHKLGRCRARPRRRARHVHEEYPVMDAARWGGTTARGTRSAFACERGVRLRLAPSHNANAIAANANAPGAGGKAGDRTRQVAAGRLTGAGPRLRSAAPLAPQQHAAGAGRCSPGRQRGSRCPHLRPGDHNGPPPEATHRRRTAAGAHPTQLSVIPIPLRRNASLERRGPPESPEECRRKASGRRRLRPHAGRRARLQCIRGARRCA